MNAAIAQRLSKGTLVELYGRIGVNTWTNTEGEAKANLIFHVNNIKLYGGIKPLINDAHTATTVSAGESNEIADDLPF